MLDTLATGLRRIEQLMTGVAAVCMFTIMVVVAVDVAMRYGLNSPLSWTYDFISLYLMAGLFFLVLSDGYANHAHVNVDILYKHLPFAARRICDLVTLATGVVFFAAVCRAGGERFWASFVAGDVLAGAIPWPTWPSYALVPVGAGAMALRLCIHLLHALASLVSGRDFNPSLAAPAGHTATE